MILDNENILEDNLHQYVDNLFVTFEHIMMKDGRDEFIREFNSFKPFLDNCANCALKYKGHNDLKFILSISSGIKTISLIHVKSYSYLTLMSITKVGDKPWPINVVINFIKDEYINSGYDEWKQWKQQLIENNNLKFTSAVGAYRQYIISI